jgi:tRNA pseudouridine55 synthase
VAYNYLCSMSKILTPQHDFVAAMPEGGVLLVNKPLGWTSFDVVNKIRFALGRRIQEKRPKVGHAGTLDPLATGLLILCIGRCTKQIDLLQAEAKVYTGHITLGATTPSYDRETDAEDLRETAHITDAMLEATRQKYVGRLNQVPPIYSAIKKEGKKLYEIARAGQSLELETRPVEIHDFTIGKAESITKNTEEETLLKPTVRYIPETHGLRVPFVVGCSKGTYIRSLAFDFGQDLGCGGYLGSLVRTQSGHFSLAQAYSVEEWVTGINGE